MRLADRMALLGTESAFEVLLLARELEREGREVVHLEIGEPDFATPDYIKDAAKQALDQGWTHYGPPLGLPELREAIAAHVSTTRGISVTPAQVAVTPGAKLAIFFAILALVEPGDEVIHPDPGFPIYESVVRFVGGIPRPLRLRYERDFSFDPDELDRSVSERTRLIILNSPHNPTGAVLSRQDLEVVARLSRERGIVVLSDEVYSRFVYSGEHISIASLPDMVERTILVDGFSKTYAMTGWRLGYGIFPGTLVPHIEKLMVNSVSCTASFVQRAGVAALTGSREPVDHMVAEFRRRRDLMVAGLSAIPGVRCLEPHGAFYVFPEVSALGMSSRILADRLLRDAGVATLPGASFGPGGEGHLRISYANSVPNLQKAIERIAAFVMASRTSAP